MQASGGLVQGHLMARVGKDPSDVARAHGLRQLAFRAGRGGGGDSFDADRFDCVSDHVLVTDRTTDTLLCCFRVQMYAGATVEQSYTAQFYDLAALGAYPAPMLEVGRFCLHPDCHDPDVLRLAWAMIARIVDARGVGLMFGCSSFVGADPALHCAALGGLGARVAPERWRPRQRAPEVVFLGNHSSVQPERTAAAALPALLRTYLGMGAWVSDHAVIDRDMDTLHVMTGVEIATIPPGRARALRSIGVEIMG